MIRHSVVKKFGTCTKSTSVVYFGIPVSIILKGDLSPSYIAEVGMEKLGITSRDIPDMDENSLIATAKDMFSSINPRTSVEDVSGDEFYASIIPKAIIGGIITPQTDEKGVTLFNGEGTITIAEVLDGFRALKRGVNAGDKRAKSLDNVSNVSDYFNEGYNMLCKSYASVFYNLYERSELFRPITRLEFAYLVVCSGYFKGVFESKYPMGVTFNWLSPSKYVGRFVDCPRYNVSLVSVGGLPSHNIKHYKGNKSVTEYLSAIKRGYSAIPLPMFMSMVELGVQDLFIYKDDELNPLRQLTRGEFSYCFSKLAKGEQL